MKWLWILLLFPGMVFAGETCTTYNGICKDSCAENEVAEVGTFFDCTADQECCVIKEEQERADLKCCIFSFDPEKYHKDNCSVPEDSLCREGTGSPLECSELDFCKSK
jgi:hypothetical protein